MKASLFCKSGAVAALTLWLCAPAPAQPTSVGAALYFFNTQQGYVSIPGYGNVAPSNEITIEFWQRVGLVQGQSTLSLNPDSDGDRINLHVPFADGVVYWDFGDSSGPGRLAYTPPVTIAGSWQHFAFVASIVPF
jgi:Concanavalin A-like lectin/glucanases superfamily